MSERLRTAKAAIRRMAPPVPEKVEQAHIQQLIRAIGGTVYTLGTRRRSTDFQGTMQTPGVPDLIAFVPDRRAAAAERVPPPHAHRLLFIECKAAGGRLRPEQRVFRDHCAAADIDHVVGGLDAVIAWLVDRGVLQSDQIPHYRQPRRPDGEEDHRVR